MKKLAKYLIITTTILLTTTLSQARDQIRIVGSSTVYPFATVVAEKFGILTKFKTPVVESTGSGGGLKISSNRKIKKPAITVHHVNGIIVMATTYPAISSITIDG